MTAVATAAIVTALTTIPVSPRAQSGSPQRPVFRAATELVLVNIVVDVLYTVSDPRVRLRAS